MRSSPAFRRASSTVSADSIYHIENRHGVHGKADSSMADARDVARMAFVMDNYDDVQVLVDKGHVITSTNFKNGDESPAPLILYTKRINGTYYLSEIVPDAKRKILWVQSAYINKKAVAYRESDATEAPPTNARNGREFTTANTIIPTPVKKFNSKFSLKDTTPADSERMAAPEAENASLRKAPDIAKAQLKLIFNTTGKTGGMIPWWSVLP